MDVYTMYVCKYIHIYVYTHPHLHTYKVALRRRRGAPGSTTEAQTAGKVSKSLSSRAARDVPLTLTRYIYIYK